MRDIILLISGKQGSGKTTLMENLRRQFAASGYRTHNLIFADTIYRIHDFAIQLLKERGIERDIVKDGKLLQLLGTEWGRATIDENIWVKCLEGQMRNILERGKDHNHSPNIFFISDCRFQNEFDGVPGAFKIRLEASREVRKERCSQWRDNDTHASEIDLDGYAAEGKFDCYVDTEQDKDLCIESVGHALKLWEAYDGSWGGSYNFENVSRKYYPRINSNIILGEN